MLNFDFSKSGQEIVSPPHVLHNFSRKLFYILYYMNLANFIVRLLLFLGISGDMSIVTDCYPVSEVMNFKIYLSFLVTFFPTCPKSQSKINRKF